MKYTDEQRLQTLVHLDGNGGNMLKTAKETGIPRMTLRGWAEGVSIHPSLTATRHMITKTLTEKVEEIALRLADILITKLDDDEKMSKLPMTQISIPFGITVDKLCLLKRSGATDTNGPRASVKIEVVYAKAKCNVDDDAITHDDVVDISAVADPDDLSFAPDVE